MVYIPSAEHHDSLCWNTQTVTAQRHVGRRNPEVLGTGLLCRKVYENSQEVIGSGLLAPRQMSHALAFEGMTTSKIETVSDCKQKAHIMFLQRMITTLLF